MATPLVATARIEARYTVAGKLHQTRMYCGMVTIGVGGASTVLDRDGVTLHTLTQVATAWFPALNGLSTDDANSYEFVLQDRSGLIWTDRDFVALTGGSGSSQKLGWQTTFVLRLGDLTKAKCVMMEGSPGILMHTSSVSGSTPAVNLMADVLTSGNSTTHNPFRWIHGRSDGVVSLTAALVGITATGNRKTRRARGLT